MSQEITLISITASLVKNLEVGWRAGRARRQISRPAVGVGRLAGWLPSSPRVCQLRPAVVSGSGLGPPVDTVTRCAAV